MFKKIMKHGAKKPSKSDHNDVVTFVQNGPSGNRNALPANAGPTNRIGDYGRPTLILGGPPPPGAMEELPLFRDVAIPERQNLFVRKLQICCYIFDFSDMKSYREKEIKRKALMDLVEYIQSGSGKINENCTEDMIKMISVNIFRCLPPGPHENAAQELNELEEEDPVNEPAWPHLQLVYELLLRYVVSADTDTKVAKRYIDHSFVLKLLELFVSEDPNEREYLKTILHRIYGRFMVHRPFIRKAINNIFYRYIYEGERHCGIGELLEIMGSIINGFALPMKEEHKLFLVRALIPLHKPKLVANYHPPLSYCVTQFVEKDYRLAEIVIRGLLKYWPLTNCQKEVLFLGELEEVLEVTHGAEFQRCMVPLFRQIARCINSHHFQVCVNSCFTMSLILNYDIASTASFIMCCAESVFFLCVC